MRILGKAYKALIQPIPSIFEDIYLKDDVSPPQFLATLVALHFTPVSESVGG